MYTTDTITESSTQMEVLQKWEQPFRDLMDEIYWPGYTQQLISDDPEAYNREYFYFMQLYN